MSDRILRAPSIGAVGSVRDSLPPGVRDALDESFERGLAEGYQRARGDLAQNALVLASKLESTQKRLDDTVASAVQCDAATVLDLAVELARWFVGQADVGDVEALRGVIDGLLAEAGSGVFELSIHPDVAAAISGSLSPNVTSIRPDPSLGTGELRLVSDGLVIERVWRQAIDRVRDGLLHDLADRRGHHHG